MAFLHAADIGLVRDGAGEKPMVAPRSRNSPPSVTMKEAMPVRHHQVADGISHRPKREGQRHQSASHSGQPARVTPSAMMVPLNPTIEPIDRSNSPAISSSVTVVATMPTWVETAR